jgi:hypothetical protein
MIRTISLFKSTYEKTEKIIEALARIGDPCSIPILEKLAKVRWSLRPKHLSRAKQLLYHTLHFYEPSTVGTLLEMGSCSPDPKIQEACRKIIQQGTDTTKQESCNT